jgi:DNA-binding NtrC family response regulator
MPTTKRTSNVVLVVDDEPGIREGLATALRRRGWDAVAVAGVAAARATLAQRHVDCVLLDVRLKDGDGLELLRELKRGPLREVPVIIATAYGDGERTIAAMRDGAFDYVTKPFDLEALTGSVRRALETSRAKVTPLARSDETLVGRSPAMQEVWKRIGRAAASREPVLVRGERGSGKETVARAVHAFSPDPAAPLVHERAAALDVDRLRELCAGPGTLLLDEVGELSPAAAHRLTTWLHEGAGARVVATVTRSADAALPHDGLDQSLYFALAVIDLDVPPLRARKSDLPLLAAHALRHARPPRALTEAAMSRLLVHDWPGNVGELIAVLRRAAALAQGELIDENELPDDLGRGTPAGTTHPYLGLPMRVAVAALERDLLVHALDRAEGNRTSAAKLLGIGRAQLYAKLAEHGLEGHRKER